ncbi:MAG: ABC transporter substrate-binding protein, partial [Chloroflexota bacterium]
AQPTAATPATAAAPTQAPAAQATTTSAQKTNLVLIGWNYQPDEVKQNVDRFAQQNPGLTVDYQSISGEYLTALIPKFQAKTPIDVVYVRDQYTAAWVDAKYIRPVNDFTEWKAIVPDLYQLNLEQSTYKGQNWGTFYYTDFDVLHWNQQMLVDAGITQAPTTLDELRSQSQTIKKQGKIEFPLEFDWTQGSDAMWDYWMFVFGSGGHLLDENGQPTYPDKDPVPLEILKWWVAAANEWKIVNAAANMQPVPQGTLTAYRSGKAAFYAYSRYDLYADNDPTQSRIAIQGKINSRLALIPGLDQNSPHYAPGWTRLYGVTSYTSHLDDAWKLAYYMGAKDKTGEYYTAKRWWLLQSLGYVFKPLAQDPEVQAHTKTFIADPGLMDQATQLARTRDGLQYPWWTDWYTHLQAQIQEAILGKKAPKDALTESANKARALAKQSA